MRVHLDDGGETTSQECAGTTAERNLLEPHAHLLPTLRVSEASPHKPSVDRRVQPRLWESENALAASPQSLELEFGGPAANCLQCFLDEFRAPGDPEDPHTQRVSPNATLPRGSCGWLHVCWSTATGFSRTEGQPEQPRGDQSTRPRPLGDRAARGCWRHGGKQQVDGPCTEQERGQAPGPQAQGQKVRTCPFLPPN